jgi:transposase
MHLRQSTRHANGKTYQYAQLVESFRRPEDGKPTVRVIAHLGRLPEATLRALRTALEAGRSQQAVVLESEVAALVQGSTLASLRYLDVAVLRWCWDQWRLSDLLDGLAGRSQADLRHSEVILPLVLQRCLAPGSKLQATRWIVETALPEMLGFDPERFENTRVHRALDALHAMTDGLQHRLVEAYERRAGPPTALFMDATDTYFEGIGPPMAELTRTKTEMPNKRCLSIVLLVNQHGYPMRWSVLGGKTKDWTAMTALLRQLGDVPWLRRAIIVFDRAMGNRSTVRELKETGLHFLTAAHSNAIESFTTALPKDAFAKVALEGTDASYQEDIARVAQVARQHPDFVEIHEHLFVLDLGVQLPTIEQPEPEPPPNQAVAEQPSRSRRRQAGLAHSLARARAIRQAINAVTPPLTQAAVATQLGLTDARVNQLLALLRLAPEVQAQIEHLGEHLPLDEKQMRALLRLEPAAQMEALSARLAECQSTPPVSDADAPREGRATSPARRANAASDAPEADHIGPLRLVAYFNPRLFVDIRRRTEQHCKDIQQRVDELNAELAKAKRSRDRDATYRKFAHELERLSYLDAFDIRLEALALKSSKGASIQSFRGAITRKEETWSRRRARDGFILLLAHPEIKESGVELVQRYRSKDAVEKDFQTIKSVCELRPVYHHTDPKVQAHVTLCMLALLLQRTLEDRLRDGGKSMTAPTGLELLSSCRVNVRKPVDGSLIYDITQATPQQKEILSALHLTELADGGRVRPTLTPRAVRAT